MVKKYPFIPYHLQTYSEDEKIKRSYEMYNFMNSRRSIRSFSDKPIPREVIENIVRTAGTAPSGANMQPWVFVIVSDSDLKRKIRLAAELEEKEFYDHKISNEWRQDLAPLGTSWEKPFLETAPQLIIVFQQKYRLDEKNIKRKNYYVIKSVGIAVGMLILAIHNAGLATLTHTPISMNFLRDLLGRPENEKAFVIMPVGYPKEDVEVPDLKRKPLSEILIWS
ncbi:MAG: nitroreductase family protein [Candidatus Heimdallarchaeota archaeon]|nr:MAG: nitroreductase family protein [Candidatus Heimdallarchaeota archaeon]